MAEPFVPIEDVAKHFAVSISTIRAWIRQGHIPRKTYVKIGNTYRFKLPAVDAALTDEIPSEVLEHTTHQLEFDFSAPDTEDKDI